MSTKTRNLNFTVPNILSVFRIILVPFFAYCIISDNPVAAIIILVVSGLTDSVDGAIARKYNQITEIGKILDPFADKITQGTVALCLAVKYPAICPILILFFIKEALMLIFATVMLIRDHKKPSASKWYGKVATVMFYVSMGVIILMSILETNFTDPNLFNIVSYILLISTAIMMLYSLIHYYHINRRIAESDDPENKMVLKEELKRRKTD
jgi:cardiolipin synthase